ncbi:MAG TPA: hypothetical protein PKM13_00960, partial [Candidatus Bipolaricaulis anaerobius]|nr:hypothetical protein [Candidatus Bipolaricaulis anaerobius]
IERDGVTYLVLGGGGAVPRELAPARVEGSVAAVEGRNFYARVAVTPAQVAVEIVSVAEATEESFHPTPGELLDSFTLGAPPRPGSGVPSTPEAVIAAFSLFVAVVWALLCLRR